MAMASFLHAVTCLLCVAPCQAAPTKVFFLLGQSNMEGQGIVEIAQGKGVGNGTLAYAVKNNPSAGLPAYDVHDAASRREACVAKGADLKGLKRANGSWQTWPNVQVDYFGKVGSNWGMVHPRGPLSVGFGVSANRGVGPELGFGVEMRKHFSADNVLLVKVAWGGTSLAHDWRPPSSVAKYGGDVGWCYTNFTTHAKTVLKDLDSYEIAGMVWHQGWNDGCSTEMVAEYERNLANLIEDIRTEFKSPKLPVSIPVSGMDSWRGRVDRRNGIIHAQYAVTQYSNLTIGTVAAQETRGFVRFFDETNGACNQGYHYNCNGESYFYVGTVAGQAMSAMLDGKWVQPYINTTNPAIDIVV